MNSDCKLLDLHPTNDYNQLYLNDNFIHNALEFDFDTLTSFVITENATEVTGGSEKWDPNYSNNDVVEKSNTESYQINTIYGSDIIDRSIFELSFPKEIESAFAYAVFELGLKYSSPKSLIALMPKCESLTTEHLKSHLQKYRVHTERSKSDFYKLYEQQIKAAFDKFKDNREWEKVLFKSDIASANEASNCNSKDVKDAISNGLNDNKMGINADNANSTNAYNGSKDNSSCGASNSAKKSESAILYDECQALCEFMHTENEATMKRLGTLFAESTAQNSPGTKKRHKIQQGLPSKSAKKIATKHSPTTNNSNG